MRKKLAAAMAATILAGAPAFAAPPPASEPRFTPAELREDLAALYQGLQSATYDVYAITPKTELDQAYSKALAGLDRPMTKFEAEVRFETFMSNIHMGHARVDFPYAVWAERLRDGGKAFPLAIRIIGDKVYVAENNSGVGDIAPGDEILTLNGQPMQQRLAQAERHVSAETPAMAHSLMEYDLPIYLWLELGDVPAFQLEVRKPHGPRLKLSLPARTQAEMKAYAAAQAPSLSLQSPAREAQVLDHDVGYLRPGPFYNAEAKTGADEWDVSSFRTFIDDAFHKFDAAGVDCLIIDLRGNPGGDNLFSDIMVAWFADKPFRFFSQFKVRVSPQSTRANAERISHDAAAAGPVSQQYAQLYAHAHNGDIVDFPMAPASPRAGERFKGRVYLLVDRQSYSNTVSVAALVQDYRFGKVIGEATSDMATSYGAMEQFALPRTGILVGYPKAFIVRPNGDQRLHGVTPDIAIPTPIEQSSADPVLDKAAALVRASSRRVAAQVRPVNAPVGDAGPGN